MVVIVIERHVTIIQWRFIPEPTQTANDIEICKPPSQEVDKWISVVAFVFQASSGNDDLACDAEVLLPRDGNVEAVRVYAFAGGEHDCGGQGGVGNR